jgi:Raf kinase inhibitor-like YbhB/YbcL family protein
MMPMIKQITVFFCLASLILIPSCAPSIAVTEEKNAINSPEIGNAIGTDSVGITLQPSLPSEENVGSLPSQEVTVVSYLLSSNDFEHKGAIPEKFTCKGEGISPQLQWKGAPEGSKSFALIMDDPDAPSGTWIHWVYYDIPANVNQLPQGIKGDNLLSDGSRNGTNSAGKIGYIGPCPPSGQHRYFFKLYALDSILDLKPGATKPDLLKAMQGHILGLAELMGTFNKY